MSSTTQVLGAAALAAAALVMAGSSVLAPVPEAPVPAPSTSGTVGGRTLACPAPPKEVGGASLVAAREDGQSTTRSIPADSPAVVLPGTDKIVSAGVWLQDRPAKGTSAWASCQPGAPDQFVQFADPARATLLLVNPGTVDALVDVALQGPAGPVAAVGTSSITVPRRGQRLVPISIQAPAGKPVTAQVVARQGRVAAWGQVVGPKGVDLMPATGQLAQSVIPAVPAAGTSSLLLANPTGKPVTVRASAHGLRGSFAPTGAGEVELAPGATRLVDISRSFAGEEGSLSLVADAPVVASVWSVVGKDLAMASAESPAQSGSLLGPGGGRLIITNPGQSNVVVTLGGKPVTVGAGAMHQIEMSQAPTRVTYSATDAITVGGVLDGKGVTLLTGSADGDAVAVPAVVPDHSLR